MNKMSFDSLVVTVKDLVGFSNAGTLHSQEALHRPAQTQKLALPSFSWRQHPEITRFSLRLTNDLEVLLFFVSS